MRERASYGACSPSHGCALLCTFSTDIEFGFSTTEGNFVFLTEQRYLLERETKAMYSPIAETLSRFHILLAAKSEVVHTRHETTRMNRLTFFRSRDGTTDNFAYEYLMLLFKFCGLLFLCGNRKGSLEHFKVVLFCCQVLPDSKTAPEYYAKTYYLPVGAKHHFGPFIISDRINSAVVTSKSSNHDFVVLRIKDAKLIAVGHL